jgi:branched-chain amino acid transport system substrate-binding protein
MTKLVTRDKVDVVLGASRTGPSLAMRPKAEASKVPMISLAANKKIVDGSSGCSRRRRTTSSSREHDHRTPSPKGWKTIGLARDASGFGEGVKEMLDELGGSRGHQGGRGREVRARRHRLHCADGQAAQRQGRRQHHLGHPAGGRARQKAYRQLGRRAPVMQSHGIGNKVFLDTAGASADGLIAPLGRLVVAGQLPEDDPQKKVITEFVAAYQAAYNERPSTFAGHAYDAYQLAIDALTKVGTDKQKIRDHLEGVKNFVGVSGVFSMTPQDTRVSPRKRSSSRPSRAASSSCWRAEVARMSDFLQLSFAGVSQGAVYALIAIGFVAIFTVSGVINLVQGSSPHLPG